MWRKRQALASDQQSWRGMLGVETLLSGPVLIEMLVM